MGYFLLGFFTALIAFGLGMWVSYRIDQQCRLDILCKGVIIYHIIFCFFSHHFGAFWLLVVRG